MTPGQTLWRPDTGARFTVEEVRGDGGEAIVRGQRTGGRLFVVPDALGRYWARSVVDNGQSGASLFDSLVPVGRRFLLYGPGAGAAARGGHVHDGGCNWAGCGPHT